MLVSFAFLRLDGWRLNPAGGSEGKHAHEAKQGEAGEVHLDSTDGSAEELQFVVDPSAIEEASLPGKVRRMGSLRLCLSGRANRTQLRGYSAGPGA